MVAGFAVWVRSDSESEEDVCEAWRLLLAMTWCLVFTRHNLVRNGRYSYLAPSGEYDSARRRCGLLPDYFDHLSILGAQIRTSSLNRS